MEALLGRKALMSAIRQQEHANRYRRASGWENMTHGAEITN